MTKKRIIAYALAITSLFGVYKGCHTYKRKLFK